MHKRLSLPLLAFFIISLQAFAQPKISIGDNKTLDFGDVNLGSKLTHEVMVKNVGTDTLRISNVKAQCGCTATILANDIIAPHDEAKMTVSFNPANYSPGKYTKHVYITSNDSTTNGIYTMEFVAEVITPLMLDPGYFSYPNAKLDSVYSKTITLTNKSKSPIVFDSLSGSNEQISFKIGKMKLMPGEQTNIEGILHPVKSGSNQGTLTVYTNIPDQRKVDIKYMAWINRK